MHGGAVENGNLQDLQQNKETIIWTITYSIYSEKVVVGGKEWRNKRK